MKEVTYQIVATRLVDFVSFYDVADHVAGGVMVRPQTSADHEPERSAAGTMAPFRDSPGVLRPHP